MNRDLETVQLSRLAVDAFLAGHHADATSAYRRLLALVPHHSAWLTDIATCVLQLGEAKDAERLSARAIAVAPGNSAAWNNLATALRARHDLPQAVLHFAIACALAPENAAFLNNLGLVEFEAGSDAAAATSLRRSLALNPSDASAHNNLGAAQIELDEASLAEASHDRALVLAPSYPEAHWNRGLRRLARGDFGGGWPDVAWRWRCANLPRLKYGEKAWDGRNSTGKRLLLYSEQGFGDTLQFARFAMHLGKHGTRVALQCQRPLTRLLASVPHVETVVADDGPPPAFDIQAPLMDVPGLLGIRLADLPGRCPYLAADPSLVEAWARRLLAPGRKIGLAWQGNPTSPGERGRSIPLSLLAPLLRRPDVAWYSLQYGVGRDQLAGLSPEVRPDDLGALFADFADTAAVLAGLDLVITTCTSVAHLAGALGKPTWVMLRRAADWRWMADRSDSPWYPSIRLFRQTRPGDWNSVVAAVRTELDALNP